MHMQTIAIVVIAQILFTASDLLGRHFMSAQGFTPRAFVSAWFLLYLTIRMAATFGQLYVFSKVELGQTMAIFGAVSIVSANALGFLLLKETLTPTAYVGVTLAVLAFMILAVRT